MRDIASHAEWHEEVSRGKMFGFLLCRSTEGEEQVLRAYSGQICGRSDWPGYVPAIFDYLQPDGYFKREEAEIVRLHQEGRPTRERSIALQRWLFSQTMLCNARGEQRSVLDVFAQWAKENHSKQTMPPSGTGECCAPKLLHHANRHGLAPLKLVEFWYGASPKGEIRHHGMRYEPCQAKCMTILDYLDPGLSSIATRTSGISGEYGTSGEYSFPSSLPILFSDPYLLAADKPAGLLSVPGKRDSYCAETILREQTGLPYLRAVHRLDMDTSGILLFAKTEEAYKAMQRMFALHEDVEKEYVAITSPPALPQGEGAITPERAFCDFASPSPRGRAGGEVSLPLSPDFLNRPRQLVDYEHGKPAITKYIVEKVNSQFSILNSQSSDSGEANSQFSILNSQSSDSGGANSQFSILNSQFTDSGEANSQFSIFNSQSSDSGGANSQFSILNSQFTTLRLFPLTGRTHQLRVHCAHPDGLGCPIVGDRLYGNISADRMYLHATRLAFRHPITGERIEIISPVPWEN